MNDRQFVALKLLSYYFSSVADEQSALLVDEILEDYIENTIMAGDLQECNYFERGELKLL